MMLDTESDDPHSPAPGTALRSGRLAEVAVDIAPSSLITPIIARSVRDRLTRAVIHLKKGGEVRLRFVDDAQMTRLHAVHCHDPTTTDVLTFNLNEAGAQTARDATASPASDSPLDVDLIICVDEARRQAVRRGHDIVDELTLYALHGVLHCLGYDDHEEEDFDAMHAREDEILRAIGVGAVFALPESSSDAKDPVDGGSQ